MDESLEYSFSVSNEELLVRCAEQDQQALYTLFRRHERPVYNLLYRMLASHEDAEEALAEVFVKVWRSAGKFRGAAKVTTWLYHIAANTARDILRSRKVKGGEVSLEDLMQGEVELVRANPDKTIDPESACLRAEERAVMAAAISRLSEDDRLLITMYHLQDASYEEMSEVTGLAASHLKVKLFRARQRLKQHCLELEKEEIAYGLQRDTTEFDGLQSGPVDAVGE